MRIGASHLFVIGIALLARRSLAADASSTMPSAVKFESFEYRGVDPYAAQVREGTYLNPILAGFYPDPSICRVGADYYLVNSSFSYFPGVPIFHSRDLVNWTQIGHVLDRPSRLKLDGLQVQQGIYAPTIRYHEGTFYMISTLVGGERGGNFYVTAKNPAGPWSEPNWLPSVGGIDPSLFFDDDGKAYVVNNDAPPEKPRYDGHRAIWLHELDIESGKVVGESKCIVNGGTDISKKPVWIEGPHLFKRNGFYFLMCAEGGTGPQHSEVIFRSKQVAGPYEPYVQGNPILTQRDLPHDRVDPITNVGHADFIETQNGEWWCVFLASRAYGAAHYNTGRETFLLPMRWEDDWPRILDRGAALPRVVKRPNLSSEAPAKFPLTGTFTWNDEFDAKSLRPEWELLRTPPDQPWYSLTDSPGSLSIVPREAQLDSTDHPSFVARRQQHLSFAVSTTLNVSSLGDAEAGLVAFQNEGHYFFMGVRMAGKSTEVFLQQFNGSNPVKPDEHPTTIASRLVEARVSRIELKLEAEGRPHTFSYRTDESRDFVTLKADVDGSILSTDVAGGFQGVMLGMYARRR